MKKQKKSKTRSPKGSRRENDPHREREAGLYEHPVPSRELILEVMVEAGVPLEEGDLARELDIRKREREAFNRRIAAMERDGQIMRNRRGDLCVADKLDLVKGQVVGHKDGFGFLVRDEGGLICPMFNEFVEARRAEVGGWFVDPNHELMNGRALAKCWLTA